jgi:DNA helicase II / ATP-dependent DNA helicase PcrA
MHRVEVLADRPPGHRSSHSLPYWNVIPLVELIAQVKGAGVSTKAVTEAYFNLLAALGSEFYILMHASLPEIEKDGGSLLAEAVRRMRAGQVTIAPGYDGEYGIIQLFDSADRAAAAPQMQLF